MLEQQKAEKQQLEERIQQMSSQLFGCQKEQLPCECAARLSELERERVTIEEDKAQVGRYKQLLLKQRDIMIALTQRLHERDETIIGLQGELDARDRRIAELEEAAEERVMNAQQPRTGLPPQASASAGSGGHFPWELHNTPKAVAAVPPQAMKPPLVPMPGADAPVSASGAVARNIGSGLGPKSRGGPGGLGNLGDLSASVPSTPSSHSHSCAMFAGSPVVGATQHGPPSVGRRADSPAFPSCREGSVAHTPEGSRGSTPQQEPRGRPPRCTREQGSPGRVAAPPQLRAASLPGERPTPHRPPSARQNSGIRTPTPLVGAVASSALPSPKLSSPSHGSLNGAQGIQPSPKLSNPTSGNMNGTASVCNDFQMSNAVGGNAGAGAAPAKELLAGLSASANAAGASALLSALGMRHSASAGRLSPGSAGGSVQSAVLSGAPPSVVPPLVPPMPCSNSVANVAAVPTVTSAVAAVPPTRPAIASQGPVAATDGSRAQADGASRSDVNPGSGNGGLGSNYAALMLREEAQRSVDALLARRRAELRRSSGSSTPG